MGKNTLANIILNLGMVLFGCAVFAFVPAFFGSGGFLLVVFSTSLGTSLLLLLVGLSIRRGIRRTGQI